jgi:lipopolysaccharide export system protein LptA
MNRWQRRARLFIGIFGIAFAIVVVFAFKPRTRPAGKAVIVQTDPGTIVQSTGGRVQRVRLSKEEVLIEYDRQLTYSDNTSKLLGVKITTTEKSGRSFTLTGKEGQAGKNESSFAIDGDVRLVASDGLAVHAEHATYTESDGMVRAPGPVEFSRGRFNGTGIGMTYDKTHDTLAITDQAVVHVRADEKGAGAADVTAGKATFARSEKTIHFEWGIHVQRASQTIDADEGSTVLSADENHIETVDLHGHSRIEVANPGAGSLKALTGQSISLKYAEDGETLRHALIVGDADARLAGETGKAGRQIVANTLDIALAPDGSTPVALNGHQGVRLTIPPEPDAAGRTITSENLDAKGEPGRGLTRAQFAGNVEYREKSVSAERIARSAALDVALKPGMSDVDDARFSSNVRFEEGLMAAIAAAARYDVGKGTLELTGSDRQPPHMLNDRIAVDAGHIAVTLVGPKIKASGNVKSVLQAPKKGQKTADTKIPSMLKSDQPVNVVGDELDYDGSASKATYTGNALLWQGDTSVKGASITIDDKSGDLSATGPVTTTALLEQSDRKDTGQMKKERVRSVATAEAFKYEEAERRARYTGDAHLSGPQGDITAERIDLYLKPSGDEVDRAEAFAAESGTVTIREQNRKTVGAHLTYTAIDDRYVIVGKPAMNTDACGNETTGATLTFVKATDTITVDGNGFRTQTKGTGACK